MKEKEFFKKYKQEDYKCPSLAADMTVFSVIESKEDDYRKLPEKVFSILLIKRAEHPFKDMWALPGGFVREAESVEEKGRQYEGWGQLPCRQITLATYTQGLYWANGAPKAQKKLPRRA